MSDPALLDFRNVLYLVWKHLNLPDPTKVQYDIAEFLQWGPKRSIIEAFRGVGKSWITSVYGVDALRLIPSLNILVVSAAKQRADDFSIFSKRLITEVPIFQHLQPREGQRDSNISFDVGPAPAAHSPSMKSQGIFGQLAGSRADLIFADDVEIPNNSATQMMREKLAATVKEFEAILKPQPTDDEIRARAPGLPLEIARQYFSRIVLLGTPQTEQSLYNGFPVESVPGGYTRRFWPARYPTPAQLPSYGDSLAPTLNAELEAKPELAGKPTDPARFDEMTLLEKEMQGRSFFALQFMLDTTLSDANRYPLKLADLCVMDLDPELGPEKVVWAASPELTWKELPNVGFTGDRFYRPMATKGDLIKYQGSVMAIDPSGRGRDECAFAVVNNINSQLFAMACHGFSGGYTPEVLRALALEAKRWRVNRIIVEENFGDGMFSALLSPVLREIYPCTLEEVKHSVQKEKRIIDTLEPVLNQHKLIVNRRIIELDSKVGADVGLEQAHQYQLFHQLTRITRDRGCLPHDDRLDALAMAVAYWVAQMGRDIDLAMGDRRTELLEAEFRRHMEHAVGYKPEERGWITPWR